MSSSPTKTVAPVVVIPDADSNTASVGEISRSLYQKGSAPETIDPETGEVKPGEGAVDYSQWENEFLTEVDKRLEKYGSAFNDLSKGRKDDALSNLQTVKLKEIAAKARGKKRKGLTTKKPLGWKNRPPPKQDE